jgi:putative transposase
MKGKKIKEEQIIKALKRMTAGEAAKDICRELGVSQQTLYNWKSKYGGMEINELVELKRLQEENSKLKRIVADQALDIVMLKDINSRKW